MTPEEMAAADKAKKDAEEKERTDRAKADAEAGEKLDKILSHLDSAHKRMDAIEARFKKDGESEEERKEREEKEKADKAKRDAETDKIAADAKARKDAEEKEKEERERAEKEKADADAAIAKRIADMEKKLPAQFSDADYKARIDAQARADDVFQAFGKSAPRPMDAETPQAYRRRLASELKGHSAFKAVDLYAIADDAAFSPMEDQIYRQATEAANNPADVPEDVLIPRTRRDSTGREITTFRGQPKAWMRQFSGNTQACVRINPNPHADVRG